MNGTPEGAARPIGFWLKLVDRLIDEKFDEVLIEHGVTHRQWQLLTVLSRGPADLATLDATISPYLADSPDDPDSSAEHLAELVDSEWLVLSGGHVIDPRNDVDAALDVAVAEPFRYNLRVDALKQ